MLDAFEARLIEVLTEALTGVPALAGVARPNDGIDDPDGDEVLVRVRLLDARPRTEVGDDELTRLGQPGDWRRRVTLQLEGEVELGFRIGEAQPSDQDQQRGRLISVVDRTLVVLAGEPWRTGHALRGEGDLGFELDGFRLLAVEAPRQPDGSGGEGRALTLRCRYAGRFWPVGEEQAGVSITGMPIRQVVLPIGLPTGLRAKAGTELDIELSAKLDAMGIGSVDAPPAVILARLLGASPGELLGAPEPGTVGWFGFAADPERGDRFVVRYRAPAGVSGKAEARIALGFTHEGGARVDLGELRVEVHE